MTRLFRHIMPIAALIATACMTESCEPDVKYSHYQPVKNRCLLRSDTLHFNTDTLRHDGRYQFTCGIRTRRDYPFQDLNMLVERRIFRNKEMIMQKTEQVVYHIVSPSGKPLGDGTGTRQHTVLLRDLLLKTGDSIAVSMQHCMKQDSLVGVSDVGLQVEIVSE